MKKYLSATIIATTLFFTLQSCGTEKTVINREVDTTKYGKMLLGNQTKDQFQKAPYNDWYNTEYAEYTTDKNAVAELKKEKIGSYNLTIFLGTWCSDSHREFPRLMKILEESKFPENKISIFALNRKKESPNGEEAKYNIQRVPTIIVSKYGKELGRIIEIPKSGFLEKDLLEIIKKDNSSFIEIFKKSDKQ